jgi:hypothetical protein
MPLAPALTLYGVGGAAIRPDDKQTALKRQKKAELDLLALQYSEEAMLTLVHVMRTSPDLRLRRDCANDLLNRGIGRTKPVAEDGQKAPGAENLLEVLAGISRVASANEQAQRALGHTPKDVTPINVIEHDAESFLRELEGGQDNGGD